MSSKFADADSDFSSSDYVIFGVPHDATGTHRKGTGQAPKSIRRESWNFETYLYDLEVDLQDLKTHDAGDFTIEKLPSILSRLGDRFPLVMGGEHSISPFIVKMLKPDSVLVLDAHLDYRDSYEGDPNSHACATRRVSEIVGVKNVIPIGVRSICREELADAGRDGLVHITADDLEGMSLDDLLEFLDDKLHGRIYVSLDIDAVDPAFAPGTGTPEPFGLAPLSVRDILRHFSDRMCGFDVCEVCPPFDNGNTAGLAAKLMRDVIGAHSLHK